MNSPGLITSSSYYHAHQTDPSQATAEEKGLINKNVQSTSFKLLQRALENEDLLSGGEEHEIASSNESRPIPKINISASQVKAPRIKESAADHDCEGS